MVVGVDHIVGEALAVTFALIVHREFGERMTEVSPAQRDEAIQAVLFHRRLRTFAVESSFEGQDRPRVSGRDQTYRLARRGGRDESSLGFSSSMSSRLTPLCFRPIRLSVLSLGGLVPSQPDKSDPRIQCHEKSCGSAEPLSSR